MDKGNIFVALFTGLSGFQLSMARFARCQIISHTKFIWYVTSYSDDNTLYAVGKTIASVIMELEEVSDAIFKWVNDNSK